MRTTGGRAMEMPRLRKATKNVAFLSRLEKSGKEQPDFPTFPQLLLLVVITISKNKTALSKVSTLTTKTRPRQLLTK
jgi:hypothetical protein